MRVLEICRSLPTHQAGGLEWHAYDLVCGLEEQGTQVTVLTTPSPATGGLVDMKASGGIHTVGDLPGRYSLRFIRELGDKVAAICATEKIDVIHAQGFAGVPLVLWPKPGFAPVVTTIHGTMFSETSLRSERLATMSFGEKLGARWRYKHRIATLPLWRKFLHTHPTLVVDSQFTRRELAREAKSNIEATVIQLGIDQRRIWARTRYEAREELVLDTDGTIFLVVGRLEPLKGHALALEAMANASVHADFKVPQPWRLILVGEGPEKQNLIDLAKKLNIASHVMFPGRVPSEKLTKMYAAADLFLNPDAGSPAFGLVTAEALLAGTPVIAMDSGATNEVLNSERDGELIQPTDSHLLAKWTEAVLRLAARLPEPAKDRFERAERAAKRFNRRDMARSMMNVFESLMPRKR
jgi:glycosyltransferase involved in cell wall biosynthesis